MRKKKPNARHLRAVPTPVDIDDAAEQVMKLADKLGAPPMPRAQYRALLEEIIGRCRVNIAATYEDDAKDEG